MFADGALTRQTASVRKDGHSPQRLQQENRRCHSSFTPVVCRAANRRGPGNGLAGVIADVQANGPGVRIDSAIESVGRVLESHHGLVGWAALGSYRSCEVTRFGENFAFKSGLLSSIAPFRTSLGRLPMLPATIDIGGRGQS